MVNYQVLIHIYDNEFMLSHLLIITIILVASLLNNTEEPEPNDT